MINANKDIIYNLFHFVNKKDFNFLVKKYNGNFSCKSVNTWKYFVSLVIGQLQEWKSLRDIELGMNYIKNINNINVCKSVKLDNLDISRSTISYKNQYDKFFLFSKIYSLNQLNIILNQNLNIVITTTIITTTTITI